MFGLLPSLDESPFRLLILWFVIFILLADVYCPPFFATFSCFSCYGRQGYGPWRKA